MQKKNMPLLLMLAFVSFMQVSCDTEKWDGDFYKENSSMQEESAFMLLDNFSFNGNESVLDIGCGDGKITYHISGKVPNGSVVGFDISTNMITTAQQIYAHVPNLSFCVKDAQDFSFDNTSPRLPPSLKLRRTGRITGQKFDYVVSFYALHWVKDIPSTYANIKKVLKPDGRLLLKIASMHKTCPLQNFFNSLDPHGKWGAAKQARAETFHGPETVEEFEAVLDTCGFTKKDVKIVYESFYFESFDNVVSWFMGWIPHCIKQSQEYSLAFCQELVTHLYNQESKKMDEPFVCSFPILSVEAS